MNSQKAPPKALRRVVFACGSVVALFFLLVFMPKVISALGGTAPELPADRQWEGHVMIAMFVVFMLGYMIGWWRSLWGGLMMIVAALLVSVPFALRGNYGTLIFGISQFIVGTLYVLLSRIGKRKSA